MSRTARFARWLTRHLQALNASAYVTEDDRGALLLLRDALNHRWPP